MCTDRNGSLEPAARGFFNPRIISPHKPEIMCVTCIDGREAAGRYFEFDDNAIRVTEIASVIPPYAKASPAMRAKFSFTKLKGISQVKIVGHSFCGGAETAIAWPETDAIANEDIRNIVESLSLSGEDLPRLRDAFMKAAENNQRHAANLLSRHLTLASIRNLQTYPQMDDLIRDKKIDLIPLYHVMKQGTGDPSHLERYDLESQCWLRADTEAQMVTHMCKRPFDCAACTSCRGTIEDSLRWTRLEYLNDNGGASMVEVPAHIARLVRMRRDFFQPGLSALPRRTLAARAGRMDRHPG